MFALYKLDLYEALKSRSISTSLPQKLMNRLYREPQSEFRSLVFDEMNALPDDDEEKVETLHKLRYVQWSFDSEQLAGILDQLSALNLRVDAFRGVEDLDDWTPSYRPDPPKGVSSTRQSSDYTVLGADFNFKDIKSVLMNSGMQP